MMSSKGQIYAMKIVDFISKTEGPVYFEQACIFIALKKHVSPIPKLLTIPDLLRELNLCGEIIYMYYSSWPVPVERCDTCCYPHFAP